MEEATCMGLLRASCQPFSQDEWTASAHMVAEADDVLAALTDPEAIAGWAPVSFEIDGLAGGRLKDGSHERVTGSLAGIRVAFDIEVERADLGGLELTADGPFALHVSYRLVEDDDGVLVRASVRMGEPRGLTALILRAAVAAVLNGRALDGALRRLEASLPCRAGAELVAA
jgi:Polyketide cyclase / dehydrase and lipid transport